MSNGIVEIEDMHISQKLFKNEELNEITQEIYEVYTNLRDHATVSSQNIAKLLSRVRSGKLYVDDGFDSVSDYAYQTFGMAKSTAYSMADAGDMYNNTEIPANIRELPPSKLVKLKSVSPATMQEDIKAGKLKPEMTQKELGEYAKVPKEIKTSNSPSSYRSSYIWGDEKKFADGTGDRKYWDDFFSNMVSIHKIGETEFKLDVSITKLQPISKPSKRGKNTKIERVLYYSERYAVLVELYPHYNNDISESEIEKRLAEARENFDVESAIQKVFEDSENVVDAESKVKDTKVKK